MDASGRNKVLDNSINEIAKEYGIQELVKSAPVAMLSPRGMKKGTRSQLLKAVVDKLPSPPVRAPARSVSLPTQASSSKIAKGADFKYDLNDWDSDVEDGDDSAC